MTRMNDNVNISINLIKYLPFFGCSPFSISQTYLTNKNKILENLESNNFTENMLNLVNGFSKDRGGMLEIDFPDPPLKSF